MEKSVKEMRDALAGTDTGKVKSAFEQFRKISTKYPLKYIRTKARRRARPERRD